MPEEKTISMKAYTILCNKAFLFDKFCSIMEHAEAEEFEYAALKLYDLYARYIRNELRNSRREGNNNVEI